MGKPPVAALPALAMNMGCIYSQVSAGACMSGQDLMQHLLAQLSLSINDKCMQSSMDIRLATLRSVLHVCTGAHDLTLAAGVTILSWQMAGTHA